MAGFGVELARRLATLESEVRRIRSGLVRMGTVAAVDATKGTIRVTYPSGVTSAPMPWFQRGSEHRPPTAGEHVVVLDPSLQGSSAVALVGHPSLAQPPAMGGGEKQVVVADAIVVEDGVVKLGANPTDYAALASKVDQYIAAMDGVLRGWAPVAMDGGAALKAAFVAAFGVSPRSVSSVVQITS